MLFRPAKQSDVPRIQELTKDIWEGYDYLGSVIENWITEGGVYVGEVEGAVVGVTRVKRNGPQELWLEGLRIDPTLQGKGLGRLMHKAVMAELTKMHPAMVRWASADTNHSVPMAEPSGFRLILKQPFLSLRLESAEQNRPLAEVLENAGARIAEPTEPGLVDYLLKICREDYAGLLSLGWQYVEATTARIEQLLQRSVVLVSGEPGQIEAAILLTPHSHAAGGVSLNLITGSPEEVKRLVPVLPSLLQTTWREREDLEVIIQEPYLPLFLSNGYEQPDFFTSQVVFEMTI